MLLLTTPQNADYSLLFGFIGGVIPVIASVLACINWLNTRFASAERERAELATEVRILQEKWNTTEDKMTLLANGSRESVAHARERFFFELNRLERETVSDIADIMNYLQKNGNFVRRHRDTEDNG